MFLWARVRGDLKAVADIEEDGKVMSQAAHHQLEWFCINKEQAFKSQVVVAIAELGSPYILLAHAAVQWLQSGQFHNEVTAP